ncbi:MAG: coproporphyrinogen III oxidase [Alphaproteobacteria bacterium]|nr:coproporphyrinogen III oxidase [Alphaproteobacteria bacterium]
MTDPRDEGFGLYVHWPFCLSKCPYCDFNSHVVDSIDQAAWRSALLAELNHFAARTPGRVLTSIFFGGGTPSLMEPETAAAIIAAARGHWVAAENLEITLEANPGTVDAARFRAIRDAGVDRLSMGVQAMNAWDLAFLGRKHSVEDARMAWTVAVKIFPRVSFDLIYARPGQDVAEWRRELSNALDEVRDNGISHLSLYQLTMEDGTKMADDFARGAFKLPNDDVAADLFDVTQELCAAAGLPAYEISNHAAVGQACRHNLTYWRGGDYVGIGPGAHGRLMLDGASRATRQIKAPALWLKRVAEKGQGTQDEAALSTTMRAEELLMMGLRIGEGVNRARFQRLAGVALDSVIDPVALARLVTLGFLTVDSRTLAATPRGRLVLNEVLRQLTKSAS